jgi:alpha-glucosidase
VEAQRHRPDSTLGLHRAAIALRRRLWTTDQLDWLDGDRRGPDRVGYGTGGDDDGDPGVGDQVIAFRRGDSACVVNLGPDPVAISDIAGLGPSARVVLASQGLIDGSVIPTDVAVWISLSGASGPGSSDDPSRQQPVSSNQEQERP